MNFNYFLENLTALFFEILTSSLRLALLINKHIALQKSALTLDGHACRQESKDEIMTKWDKVFKIGPSKTCGGEPFKNLKGYGLLKQAISLQIF